MTKLLTLRDVMQMTALSRSAVYALMGTAQFPRRLLPSTSAPRSCARLATLNRFTDLIVYITNAQ